VSRWLNDPAHQRLLERGLARLSQLRAAWEAQTQLGEPTTQL
jgi:hypothetical protein